MQNKIPLASCQDWILSPRDFFAIRLWMAFKRESHAELYKTPAPFSGATDHRLDFVSPVESLFDLRP